MGRERRRGAYKLERKPEAAQFVLEKHKDQEGMFKEVCSRDLTSFVRFRLQASLRKKRTTLLQAEQPVFAEAHIDCTMDLDTIFRLKRMDTSREQPYGTVCMCMHVIIFAFELNNLE